MLNHPFKNTAALAAALSLFTAFAPAVNTSASTIEIAKPEMKQNTMAKLPGIHNQPISLKAHSVKVSGAAVQFSGKYTAAFLDNIRNGNNRLSYSGALSDAKTSLSELVSFYCSMGSSIQYYECKDSRGTYLEITEKYWDVVKNAVKKADSGWKSYEAYVADACYSLNLNTSDTNLVNQINDYICRNFDYRVTNAGMPNFISTGIGQCWHYAKLFADMCNAVGISAKKVENSDHAWNEVTVDGVTYTFDVTYNDTGNDWDAYSWLNPTGKSTATSGSRTSSGKNTWVKNNGAWQYIGSNGNIVKSGWVQSGSKWFYMNKWGNMMTSSWLQTGGKWYYLKADGSMATDTWVDGCYVNKNGVWVQ